LFIKSVWLDLGFHPSASSPSKVLSSDPKQPLEFFQDLVIFLATEILFSISVIPAIKKRINRKLSPMKPITPVFVLRVDTLRNKYGKYFNAGCGLGSAIKRYSGQPDKRRKSAADPDFKQQSSYTAKLSAYGTLSSAVSAFQTANTA
jgi:hypothetical protein